MAVAGYAFQCLCCGAVHTVAAREAPDGPEALVNQGRECPDCALHGRPRFPLWRWRYVPAPTAAERDALRGLMVRLQRCADLAEYEATHQPDSPARPRLQAAAIARAAALTYAAKLAGKASEEA